MQKVIIPALALLIGMALGALLMKNSGACSTEQCHKKPDSTLVSPEQLHLDFAQTPASGHSVADPDTEPIKIDLAQSLFNYYLQDPIKTTPINSPVCTTPNDVLFGWSINLSKIEEIKRKYNGEMTRFSLIFGRHPSGPLTLMIVPENDQDEFLLADDMILEYVRPCPPKCKTNAHFYEFDPTSNSMSLKSTRHYGGQNPCMRSPFDK